MKKAKLKRAKGGGAKPKGDFAEKRAWFSTRITETTRDALESEVRLSLGNRSLSQVAEELLELGLETKRQRERISATRGICFLIGELAGMVSPYRAADNKPDFQWNTNPFLFEAFKLGVLKVLDSFKPPGEVRSPVVDDPKFPHGHAYGPFNTPQGQADWAVPILLHNYEKAKASDVQERFGVDPVSGNPAISGSTAARIERTLYGMAQAKRDLQIKPNGGKS